MNIYYSARSTFARDYDELGLNWEGYTQWRGLSWLTEVISVDEVLNKDLMQFDQNNSEDWQHVVTFGLLRTDFYKSLDYIKKRIIPKDRFNLLAVAIEPGQNCRNIQPDDFEFVGYDLLDDCFGISSLTNCDGFVPSHSSDDLNAYGLLNDFEKACGVQKRLKENNPGHGHEVTNVIAVWRHRVIGRRKQELVLEERTTEDRRKGG